jgi:hypothetical protein
MRRFFSQISTLLEARDLTLASLCVGMLSVSFSLYALARENRPTAIADSALGKNLGGAEGNPQCCINPRRPGCACYYSCTDTQVDGGCPAQTTATALGCVNGKCNADDTGNPNATCSTTNAERGQNLCTRTGGYAACANVSQCPSTSAFQCAFVQLAWNDPHNTLTTNVAVCNAPFCVNGQPQNVCN